jgi:transposase-like protein
MVTHQSKQEIWKAHVEKASHHPGGVAGYCREMKLNSSKFYFWRKKIQSSKKNTSIKRFLPVIAASIEQKAPSSVARTDAEWVGQVLASLIRGLR